MTNSEAIRSAPPPEDLPENVLNAAIKEILAKDNPYSYSTITAVNRFLRQFNLNSRLEADDVLSEAYLRGRKYIRSGGVISNPYAWLKATCFNIIRETSRKQHKEQLHAPEVVEFLPTLATEKSLGVQQDVDGNFRALLESLENLKRTDPIACKLLHLKTIEGLSWREIRDRLIQEGETAQTESALRQKGTRAKKILRRIYHSLV